jgi:hypothetical protein
MPDPRLAELVAYLAKVDHATTHADFWAGWDALAGDLADQAWAEDADPWLREAFTDLLSMADDAGWAVPTEQIQP